MNAHTSDAEKQAMMCRLVQQHYADAHRISVTVSDTGKGKHLRWHYSEDLIAIKQEEEEGKLPRGLTPAASHASVDSDGDSQMGDDEDRAHTPQPLGAYDPGSVVLTPHKRWNGVQREPRIGGGFDWWHNKSAVEERIMFVRDGPDGGHVGAAREQLGRDAMDVFDVLRTQRERYGSAPYDVDDDARSTASIASEATVIIDPRNPTQQTLFNGEMPIVRQPTMPSDYDESGSMSSWGTASSDGLQPRAHRALSTIQEEASRYEDKRRPNARVPPRVPNFDYVRLYHDHQGNFVRDGSLPPDGEYHIDRNVLPPKITEAGRAAELRATLATRALQRTDTELVYPDNEPVVQRAEPVIQPAEPVVQPAEPVVQPAEPVVQPAERVARPTRKRKLVMFVELPLRPQPQHRAEPPAHSPVRRSERLRAKQ